MTGVKPYRLRTWQRPMIWGRRDLRPWAGEVAEDIGEIWYLPEPELPLLVKLIFTADKLSVQVHPDDRDGEPGKTEMWYVMRADPGARIALGFGEPITRERLKEAALSGEVEGLLKWFPVRAGQAYLTPARTVHALGPGLVLCEIQQNCDTTYRLFDYNRGRPLHVDRACAIAELGPHPGPAVPVAISDTERLLVDCPHFATREIEVRGNAVWRGDPAHPYLLVCTAGSGCFDDREFRAGECWMVPQNAPAFAVEAAGRAHFLRTEPGTPAEPPR